MYLFFGFKLCEANVGRSGKLIENALFYEHFFVYVHAYSTFHSHKRGLLVKVHMTDLSS